MTTERMAYSIEEAANLAGVCRDRVYALIRSKELRARKSGRRTLILRGDLEAYLQALPDLDLGSAKS